MTFDDFVQFSHSSKVEELHIESLEGDIFLFRVFVEGQSSILINEKGQPLRPQSLGHARKMLIEAGGIDGVPLYLVQETPYDEMIGLDAQNESHKMQITLHSGF